MSGWQKPETAPTHEPIICYGTMGGKPWVFEGYRTDFPPWPEGRVRAVEPYSGHNCCIVGWMPIPKVTRAAQPEWWPDNGLLPQGDSETSAPV